MKFQDSISVDKFLKQFESFTTNSKQFSDLKIQTFKKTLNGALKIFIRPWARRNQKHIKQNYSLMWINITLEEQLNLKNLIPHYYKNKIYLIYPHIIKKIYLHYLAKAISHFYPKKILEIGSGNGINLFCLSYVTESKLCGIELTKGGVEAAKKIQQGNQLPEYLNDFVKFEGFRKNQNFKNINFFQNDAKEFNLNEKFDFIFTALALEQMNDIKVEVLNNIKKHSSSIVVFIEPFDEFNKSLTRKLWIKSENYFNLAYKNLYKYGFEIIEVIDSFPSKLTLGVGIVIAKVKQ